MTGKIFISYRRDDVRDMAARIRDRLAATIGDNNIFMDVDNLSPGQRFDLALNRALGETKVLLAVIGPRWEEVFTQRIASTERDYVRAEIAAALERGIVVIPLLIERTPMPRAEALPDDIRDLVLHQSHTITHDHFGRDIAALVQSIRRGGRRTGAAILRWGVVTLVALVLAGALFYRPTEPTPPPPGIDQTGSASGPQPGDKHADGSGLHKDPTQKVVSSAPAPPPVLAPPDANNIRLAITDPMTESLFRAESAVLHGKAKLLARGDTTTSATHTLSIAGTECDNVGAEPGECPSGHKYTWTLEFELIPLAGSGPSRRSRVTGAECHGTRQTAELRRDACKRAVQLMLQKLREWVN